MTNPWRILLIDEAAEDRELTTLVLRHELPDARVTAVADAVSLAEAFAGSDPNVVITEYRLTWESGAKLLLALQRRFPRATILVFTDVEPGTLARDNVLGLAHAHIKKSSGGFLRLAQAVQRASSRWRTGPEYAGALYQSLLEGGPVGIFVVSDAGTFLQASEALASMLGASSAGELKGRSIEAFFEPTLQARWQDAVADHGSLEAAEGEMRRLDGGVFRARLNVWPTIDVDGRPANWQGTVEDLSTLEEAERKRQMVEYDLARARDQVWDLSHALSHDLQEPLQLVSRAAQVLARDHAIELSTQGRTLLENLVQSARRALELVDAILEYSKVTGAEQRASLTDLNAVVDEAVASLKARIDEAGGEVLWHELPSVSGDPRQMLQLFWNLIGNAIKFRGEEPPRVEVSAERQGDRWLLSVSDNGIGMDPHQAERVFAMFERLHTEEEYPGTGIGLAICKKIVERHGGRIWVVSRSGEGSTFYVTLPITEGSRGDDVERFG